MDGNVGTFDSTRTYERNLALVEKVKWSIKSCGADPPNHTPNDERSMSSAAAPPICALTARAGGKVPKQKKSERERARARASEKEES